MNYLMLHDGDSCLKDTDLFFAQGGNADDLNAFIAEKYGITAANKHRHFFSEKAKSILSRYANSDLLFVEE